VTCEGEWARRARNSQFIAFYEKISKCFINGFPYGIINVDESGISNGFGGIIRICSALIRNCVMKLFILSQNPNLI
jgi:hypothetical protein